MYVQMLVGARPLGVPDYWMQNYWNSTVNAFAKFIK